MERNANTNAVAEAMGGTPSTIRTWARAGRIPFTQTASKHRRFDIDEVREALDPTTSRRTPMPRTGLGTGKPVARSEQMAARQRMLVGRCENHHATPKPSTGPRSALVELIEPRRSTSTSFQTVAEPRDSAPARRPRPDHRDCLTSRRDLGPSPAWHSLDSYRS